MSEITRAVIEDLLPLYLANEVSEDTAKLVKSHLESDPELAELAKEMAKVYSLNEAPAPFGKEAVMKSYQEAKKNMTIRTLGLALIGSLMFLCVLFGLLAFYVIAIPK